MSPMPMTLPGMVRTRVRAALRRAHPSRPAGSVRDAGPTGEAGAGYGGRPQYAQPPRRAAQRMRRPAPAVVRTPEQTEARALALRLASLMLQYPDAELVAARPTLAAAAADAAADPASPAGGHLAAFAEWFCGQEPEELERTYVETFDLRRRSSLYLTYYLHGDTRRRGMALLTLAQRYRAAGWDTGGGELPDHLPVVLEFAALAGPGRGEAPLRQHRRGLDLIHRSLTDSGSPYRHVLAAVLGLLPPPSEADRAAVAELAAQGPPAEEVGLGTGLEPYGAGEFAPPDAFVPPQVAVPTLVPPTGPDGSAGTAAAGPANPASQAAGRASGPPCQPPPPHASPSVCPPSPQSPSSLSSPLPNPEGLR